jgi:hypothetical protein
MGEIVTALDISGAHSANNKMRKLEQANLQREVPLRSILCLPVVSARINP